jgi:hypothetical protein
MAAVDRERQLSELGLAEDERMMGVIRSAMNALSSAAKTTPMTKATASSTRFRRSRNFLKSASIDMR